MALSLVWDAEKNSENTEMRSELLWTTSLSAFLFPIVSKTSSLLEHTSICFIHSEILLSKNSNLWQKISLPSHISSNTLSLEMRHIFLTRCSLFRGYITIPSTSACGQIKLCLYFRIWESFEEWEIGVYCGEASGIVPANMGFDNHRGWLEMIHHFLTNNIVKKHWRPEFLNQ